MREKDFSASFQGCSDVTIRPDRPLTLSRPGQLPSCCNFKGQHWTLYVQGEFSYSSLPRHFKNADKELNSSYKDDLENIIKDLRRKEEIVEYDRMFHCTNLPCSKILSRSRSISDSENFNPTVTETKSTGTRRQQAFIPCKSNNCVSDDVTNPEPGSLSHEGSSSSSRNENLASQEESTASMRNECLMEVINRNCTDIRNQLAVLESVSEMIDRAKVNFSVKTRRTKNDESASPLASGLRKKDNFVVINESFDEKTEACSATFHKADETQPTVVLKTPPQPPSSPELLLKLNVTSSGSSSYSSPSKKLKSRKSRNRSLQRCSENRLSVTERRSRTLSPSLTERLDHRISRATQTCHNSATFVCLPQMTNAERLNSKMESHDIISSQGQRPVVPAVTVEQNGHQCNVQQNDNLVNNETLGKQCQEGVKASPFLSQDRKSAIKNSLSFSFRARPHEKKQSLLKQDLACSAESTQPSVVPCTDVSKADQHCQHSESLLDKMHKKLYPSQYNKQSRKRPTEVALGLGTKKTVGPSSSLPVSVALPQAKASLPLQKLLVHHCVHENPECSSPMVLNAITNSDEIPVAIVKPSTYGDTLSGDLASPSSGYGELSPPSLKENASSCSYSSTLSPEQSVTSCSTPSPANCTHSSLKTVKEESSAGTRKVLICFLIIVVLKPSILHQS